jgi:hypothetical protein
MSSRRHTVCVLATAVAAEAAAIRQVLSKPVEIGRLIPLIEQGAGTP